MGQPKYIATTATSPSPPHAFFKSIELTADGTCLVTNSDDNIIRNYALPADLLSSPGPHTLTPYASNTFPGPINAIAAASYFNLADSTTMQYLVSIRDHPIRLHHSPTNDLLGSYPLIHGPTESYLAPSSFLFYQNDYKFFAGAENLIATFDLNRSGEPPLTSHQTTASRRSTSGLKGIVSALSMSCDGILAAGTFTRGVALYNSSDFRDAQIFSVGDNSNRQSAGDATIGGAGITSMKWSPCGRYLYIAERQSDGIHVYDIRVSGRKLGVLAGRRARTNQRMGFDIATAGAERQDREHADAGVFDNEYDQNARNSSPTYAPYPVNPPATSSSLEGGGHHNIIAGGTDGGVRVWENPHYVVEVQHPVDGLGWKAHDDAIPGVVKHPACDVVATCSGQRHYEHDWDGDSDDEGGQEGNRQEKRGNGEFSIKIWSGGGLGSGSAGPGRID